MNQIKGFFLSFGLFFVAFSTLIVLVNFIVDPYEIYFDSDKPMDLNGHWRITKPIWYSQGEYTDVLLGSSRVMSGIDPIDFEIIFGRQAFNFGLPGMRYFEMEKLIEFSIENSNTDSINIWLFLDAYLMPMNESKSQNENIDWLPSSYDLIGELKYNGSTYVKSLLALTALKESIVKMVNKNDKAEKWYKTGYSKNGDLKYNFKHYDRDIKRWQKKAKFLYSDNKQESFERSIKYLMEYDKKPLNVILVHLPIHESVVKIIDCGEWSLVSESKSQMLDFIEEKNYVQDLNYYDFLIDSPFSIEDPSMKKRSIYLRDLSHLNARCGDQILKIISKNKLKSKFHISADYKFFHEALSDLRIDCN